MPKSKAERLVEYLISSQDVNERMRRLMLISSDKRNLSEKEEEAYDVVFKDTFAPIKLVNGIETLDVDKLRINVKAYKEEQAKLKVEKGREVLRWLAYYDEKDKRENKEPERHPSGKKVNIDKALAATDGLKSEADIGFMFPMITGLCNEVGKLPSGVISNDGKEISSSDVISDIVREQYYPEDLFTEEEERLYYLGTLEPEKRINNVSPENKGKESPDNEKLMLFEEEKKILLIGRPWYTDKEYEEYKEENSAKFNNPEISKDVDYVKEVIKTDVPDDVNQVLNEDIPTFVNKNKIAALDAIHVCTLLSQGKTLEEIESSRPFKFDDYMKAQKLRVQAEIPGLSGIMNPFEDVMVTASNKLRDMNNKLFTKDVNLESPEVQKVIEIQSNIQKMLRRAPLELKRYDEIKGKLMDSKEKFEFGANFSNEVDQGFTVAFGNAIPKRNLDRKSLEDFLIKGGFNSTAVNRKSSILATAYAYKAVKSIGFDQKKPYDREFLTDCGEDFLQFIENNPINYEKNQSSEEMEKTKASIKAHAEFYRKWAEMNVTRFTFSDYANKKNIIGHEKEISLFHFGVDSSQSGQSILQNFGKEFKEAYGGEKYYNALSNICGMLQTISMGTTALANPKESLAQKVRWKYLFERAAAGDGNLEGKNILEIDPELYNFERANIFELRALSAINEMPPEEAERYLETGELREEVKAKLANAWEESKAATPLNIKEDQRLVASILGVPTLKGEKGSTKTGFEETDEMPEFTDRLKNLLVKEGKSAVAAVNIGLREYISANPELENEINREEAQLAYDVFSMAMPVNLSDEEKGKFVAKCMSVLNGPEEEARPYLDKIFGYIDGFSFANYNLDCLKNGKDNSEPDFDGCTESERDVLGLTKMVKLSSCINKLQEKFPNYFSEKNYSPLKSLDFSGKITQLTFAGYSLSDRLNANGIDMKKLEPLKPNAEKRNSFINDQTLAVANSYFENRSKIQRGKNNLDCTGVIRFDASDKEKAVNTIINLELLYKKTDMAGIGKNIGWEANAGKNFYIDGVRADIYIEPYVSTGYDKEDATDEILENFIVEGKHRIDCVIPGLDKDGNVVPVIQTIEPITESSKKFYSADPNRAERLKSIEENFNRTLGKETQFKKLTTSEEIGFTSKMYNEYDPSKHLGLKQLPSFEETAAKHLEELSKIDSWYHKNSQQFKDIKTALETPDNKQGVLDACNAYIGKYFKEKNTYERATDLGNARMKKILEIKLFFKTELEKDNRIAMEKTNKKDVDKEQINILKEEKKGESKSFGGFSKLKKEISGEKSLSENEGKSRNSIV